jgi:hypothetical protein
MNDDPGPSSAARQLPPRSDAGGEHHVDEHSVHAEESRDGQSDEGAGPAPRQQEEKRREGLVKTLELVSHLQKSLDMIVFVYICTLYYME